MAIQLFLQGSQNNGHLLGYITDEHRNFIEMALLASFATLMPTKEFRFKRGCVTNCVLLPASPVGLTGSTGWSPTMAPFYGVNQF